MFEKALTHVVTVLVLGLVLGGLARVARRTSPKQDLYTGMHEMRYTTATRAAMWGSCSVFALLTGGAYWTMRLPNGPPLFVFLLFLAFLVLCILAVMETNGVRVSWTESELRATTPWSGDKRIAWSDIETFTYAEAAGWLRVSSRSGETIRIPYSLGGVDAFLDDAEGILEPSVCSSALLGIRKRLAQGR